MKLPILLYTIITSPLLANVAEAPNEHKQPPGYRYAYPLNDRQNHIGISGSYLYWQLEQNFVYYAEQDTSSITMNQNIPPIDFLITTSGAFLENLITDTPLTKSGYRVTLSGYNDENPGLESVISYHSISHSEVTVDCDK